MSDTTPLFKNAKEQLIYYVRGFCRYFAWIGRQAGIPFPETQALNLLMDTLGEDFLIAKTTEAWKKYGESFRNESLAGVAKVVAEISQGMTVRDITEEMRKFTSFLTNTENHLSCFFRFWRISTKY